MAKVAVYNIEGKEVEKIDLNDAVFGVEINEHLVHMAVVAQLANKRQGTQSAKTRSEVSGGGRKPWRQKGTGHARQGSTRSPQWTGGGVVFAPKPRDYSMKMNKREKALALKSALTAKLNDNKLVVVDKIELAEIKTKAVANMLGNLKAEKALIVTNGINNNLVVSANNIPTVRTSSIEVLNNEDKREVRSTINVYDIMKYDTLVVTKDAVAAIEEVYA
jgi:large subunit ribosomal protein L4